MKAEKQDETLGTRPNPADREYFEERIRKQSCCGKGSLEQLMSGIYLQPLVQAAWEGFCLGCARQPLSPPAQPEQVGLPKLTGEYMLGYFAGKSAAEHAEPAQSGERCPDCDEAAKDAYSDATTAGFFYAKCRKHRDQPVPTVPARPEPMDVFNQVAEKHGIQFHPRMMGPVIEEAMREYAESRLSSGWHEKLHDREWTGKIMHETWSKTKRVQGFHGPKDHCPYQPQPSSYYGSDCCHKFHADLIPWDDLPEAQKDINRHAFDAILAALPTSPLGWHEVAKGELPTFKTEVIVWMLGKKADDLLWVPRISLGHLERTDETGLVWVTSWGGQYQTGHIISHWRELPPAPTQVQTDGGKK